MSSRSKSSRHAQVIMHFNAVRNAVQATLAKLRKETEERQEAGKAVADYSLGFANAFVMIEHHLVGREGAPKFYDHQGAIGVLPKPVQFTHEMQEERLAREEFDAEMAQIIVQAKKFLGVLAPYELWPGVREEAMKLSDMLKAFDKEETHEGEKHDSSQPSDDAGGDAAMAGHEVQEPAACSVDRSGGAGSDEQHQGT